MSVKEYNISLQESVPMTQRRVAPVLTGQDLFKSTGETRSQEWSGPWQEILDKMGTLPASMTERLDATATREADGDFGTLRATWTFFEAAADGEQAEPPGSSRSNPQYECQVSASQEPILTHPALAYLPLNYIKALKMLMDGYTLEDKIYDEGFQAEVTLKTLLDQIPTPEATRLVLQGCTHYLSPQVVLTVRYRAASVPALPTACTVFSSIPGPFQAPAGRNWLFEAPSISVQDGELWVSETYRLSGPGGWSEFLYGNANS